MAVEEPNSLKTLSKKENQGLKEAEIIIYETNTTIARSQEHFNSLATTSRTTA
ncbi:MAG: hypothetical protein ACP5K8_08820 [Nitrososphaeria archaeon]